MGSGANVAPTRAAEVRASRLRHWGAREALKLLGAVSLAAAVLGVVLGAIAGAKVAVPTAIGVWYASVLVGGITAALKAARPKPDPPATVRATAEGLFVDGVLVASRSEIVSGTVMPETVVPHVFASASLERGPPMLRLQRKGALAGVIDVRVDSVEDGRALLAGLELDAAHAVGISKASSPFVAYAAVAYALSCFGGGLSGALARGAPTLAAAVGVTLAIAFVASLVSMMTPMTVVVGTDGIALRWLAWKRFIPMAQIRSAVVPPESGTVVLELTSGETQRITFRGGRGRRSPAAQNAWVEAAALKERIDEAMGVGADLGGDDAKALSRGERSVAQWVTDLRQAMRGEGTFREAPLVAERLWRIVESSRAELEKRAAAAIALGAQLDDTGRERLRVAAASTASPKLRVAFEAAATDDDASAAEALDELEAAAE